MRVRLLVDVELNYQDIQHMQEQIDTQPPADVAIEGSRVLHGRLMGATPVEVGE